MTVRWDKTKEKNVENPKADAFLADIVAVCKKHGLSLGHEDGHGAFTIGTFNEDKVEWLMCAHIEDELPKQPTVVSPD